MDNVKERMPFFDNMKGVLIILVVAGHFFNGAVTANIIPAWHIFNFIYMFHMPLFIFVSGLFCKSVYTAHTNTGDVTGEDTAMNAGTGTAISKSKNSGFRAGTVLYYLLLCWLMYLALWTPQQILGIAPPLNLLTVDASMPWYLMALAIYIALVPLFSSLKPLFAICCAFFLAVLSGLVDVGDTFSANRVIVFLPFFLIGYYLNPRSILNRIEKLGKRLALARICAICVIAVIFLGFTALDLGQMQLSQTVFTGNEPYSEAIVFVEGANGFTCCIVRIVGFALAILMGICIMALMPRSEIFMLSRTGRHSLQVYIFHSFVSYAFAFIGVAPLLYKAMPPIAASITILALGIVVAVAIGWPDFIQKGFNRLKAAMNIMCR